MCVLVWTQPTVIPNVRMEECVFALENADVLLDLVEDTVTKVTRFVWRELEMKYLFGPTQMNLLNLIWKPESLYVSFLFYTAVSLYQTHCRFLLTSVRKWNTKRFPTKHISKTFPWNKTAAVDQWACSKSFMIITCCWLVWFTVCLCFAVTCDGGCWNGGECIAVNGAAKCICPSSWTGSKCQEGPFKVVYNYSIDTKGQSHQMELVSQLEPTEAFLRLFQFQVVVMTGGLPACTWWLTHPWQ